VASIQMHAAVAQGGHHEPVSPTIARSSSADEHHLHFLLIPNLARMSGGATASTQRQARWRQPNATLPLTHATGAVQNSTNAPNLALRANGTSETLVPRATALHSDQHGPNATAPHHAFPGHQDVVPLVRGALHHVTPYAGQNDQHRHEDDIWRKSSQSPQTVGPLGLPKLALALVLDLVAMIVYVALIPIVLNLAKKPDTIMGPIRYCADRICRSCGP